MQFESAIQLLVDADVDFVVIGGLAAIIHGASQLTYDLDVHYSREPSNLARLVHALAPIEPRPRGFPPDLPFVWDARTLSSSTILTLQTTIGPIDLLGEVSGFGSYSEAAAQSIQVEAFGRLFRILDLPALIHSKRAAGRPKDLAALPELESLLEAQDGPLS